MREEKSVNETLSSTIVRSGKAQKKQSFLKRQRILIVAAIILIVVLVPALIVVNFIVNRFYFTDYDGQTYVIKKVDGVYGMYTKDGQLLDITPDGYYATTGLSTLVEVNKDTGAHVTVAVVDTEEGEYVDAADRLLMFRHIAMDDIQEIVISNETGKITFYRNKDDQIVIKGFENYIYSETVYQSMASHAGYSLSLMKIKDPINDDGHYSEYGFKGRTDENGKTSVYTDIGYKITDTSKNSYTVYLGDETPDGSGYYVYYTGRDAIYVMDYLVYGQVMDMYSSVQHSHDIKNIMVEPLEAYITPMISYPMSANDYFEVYDFAIYHGDEYMKALGTYNTALEEYEKTHKTEAGETTDGDEPEFDCKPIVSFSFWSMDERFGTFYQTWSYVMNYPENYFLNTENSSTALASFNETYYEGVKKVAPGDDDLKEYGLDIPAFVISFEFHEIPHVLLFSETTADNTIYIYSTFSDMIVEVVADQFLFLKFDLTDWVNPNYFDMNIAWLTELTIESGDEKYTFRTDNSKSDSMSNPTYSDAAFEDKTISSSNMTLIATDNKGTTWEAVSNYQLDDKNGFHWKITDEKITVTDKDGNTVKFDGAMKTENLLGDVVTVFSGYIEGADGSQVSVDANTITVVNPTGGTKVYRRFGMKNFRALYKDLLYASIEGNAHDGTFGLSDEDIKKETSRPDSECQTIITVKTCFDEVPGYVYRFYDYSERRSLLTVNGGDAEFYVLRTFTDKMVTDARRVIDEEKVDYTTKY